MKRFCVKWLDIVGDCGGWLTMEEALEDKPLEVETQGWIIYECQEYIILASTFAPPVEDQEDSLGGINAIPRGCILKITEMAEKAS